MKTTEELLSQVLSTVQTSGPLTAYEVLKHVKKVGSKVNLTDVQHALVAHELRDALVITHVVASDQCVWGVPTNA